MESGRGGKIFISFLLTVLVTQSLVTLVKCRNVEKEFADQKNYYSPDPHAVSPPLHAVSPPRQSHRTPSCPPPPHGRSGCSCGPSHTAPPPHSGGGYNKSPPPSPTVVPISPLPPTIPVGPPAPTTPSTPSQPSPPYIPVDPNTPPFTPGGGTPGTCTYWSSNPTLIWGIFGYWATMGELFGPITTTLPFGTNQSVQEALANTSTDGFGALVREGTASYLNSLVNKKFPFSTQEVKHAFVSSLVSEKAAGEQARVFKLANEGRLKKH